MSKIYLSVVIPSYNERENLERGVLAQVRDYLKNQKYTWEVIVSDDDSPDVKSKELAETFCKKNAGFIYRQNAHGGKPIALWGGIQQASGQIILFTDMDQSTPIAEIDKLLPHFTDNDVVIGSRGVERKNFPFLRRLASVIFREIRRSLLLTELIDTQAGFKAIRANIAKEIFPRLNVVKAHGTAKGWTVTAWDVELLEIAKERGYKIVEVPITWQDRDESEAKPVNANRGNLLKSR